MTDHMGDYDLGTKLDQRQRLHNNRVEHASKQVHEAKRKLKERQEALEELTGYTTLQTMYKGLNARLSAAKAWYVDQDYALKESDPLKALYSILFKDLWEGPVE